MEEALRVVLALLQTSLSPGGGLGNCYGCGTGNVRLASIVVSCSVASCINETEDIRGVWEAGIDDRKAEQGIITCLLVAVNASHLAGVVAVTT